MSLESTGKYRKPAPYWIEAIFIIVTYNLNSDIILKTLISVIDKAQSPVEAIIMDHYRAPEGGVVGIQPRGGDRHAPFSGRSEDINRPTATKGTVESSFGCYGIPTSLRKGRRRREEK